MDLARHLALAALAGALTLTNAAPAQAMAPATAGLACGEYREVDSDLQRTLIIRNSQQARYVLPEMAPDNLLYEVDGSSLMTYGLDSGSTEDSRLERGGKRIVGRVEYELAKPLACEPVDLPPPGTCRADLKQCFSTIFDADEKTLRGWCDEGVGYACKRMIDTWADAAKGNPADDLPEPAVCKQDTPQFDEDACRQAAKEALAQVFAKMFDFGGASAPLPAARLDELPALCERSGSAQVCHTVAEALWDGGRYAAARTALQTGCKRGGDPNACAEVAPLATLTDADLRVAAGTQLPCGTYKADTGLMDELGFGDQGLVTATFGTTLRARLENGQVRMRHDKGGDFVFGVLPGQRLLGLDNWNRFALYTRTGGADACAAPIAFKEIPLPQDCPAVAESDARQCCARGNLQGCNIVGNQRALAGDWAQARTSYLKVCEKGVRVGCENLLQVYSEGGDASVRDDLERMCAKDARHVACDVIATASWGMLEIGAAMKRASDALEAEGEQDDGGSDAEAE